jgi:hypothetical protein
MGEESVLIGISDRMITSRDVEFESRLTKICGFAPANVVCLGAGDADATFEICSDTHHQVMGNGATSVRAVAELFADSHATLRRSRLERLWLSPLKLDLDTFISRQQEMDPALVSELAERMQAEEGDLGAEAIIAGVEPTGAVHIYHIDDPGTSVCCDRSGFLAIGYGARHFETLFMSAGYDSKWPFFATLLLAFQAKKLAELAPGVGKSTDIILMRKEGVRAFLPEELNVIEKYNDEFGRRNVQVRSEITQAMANDNKILARILAP